MRGLVFGSLLLAACGGDSTKNQGGVPATERSEGGGPEDASVALDEGAPTPDADSPDAVAEAAEGPLDEVAALLAGRFDSADQADEDAAYYPISLRVCPASVPALGERVLYVEQAMVGRVDEPYRQRLYVLERDGERIRSVVWAFEQPELLVGWCDALIRPGIEEAVPVPREGCTVFLERVGDRNYAGATDGHATAEVELFADRVQSWDRGYDATGTQVWGAVAGPYRFVRRE